MPVTDIDRAKAFYADQVGFVLYLDAQPVEGMRIVQLDPARLSLLSTGLPQLADMAPGSIKSLHQQRSQSSR